MSEAIVSYNVRSLIDQWMEAERNGEQFPVDLDIAWSIPGYADKGKAKRRLTSKSSRLIEGVDYKIDKGVPLTRTGKSELSGRSSDKVVLTCDAFKQLCLIAETDEGRNIRQYFIEAEKKWQMVEKVNPALAQQIEYQLLINEGHRLEAQKHSAELAVLQFRKMVIDIAPEPVQQKILGYSEVKTVEYRDRIIKNDDLINDGSTVTKTELCKRYGLVTRNGKPDYKYLNYLIADAGLADNPDAWDTSVSIREDKQLKRDAVPILDSHYNAMPRNRYIVE